MTRKKHNKISSNKNSNKYRFFLTNAFGAGREHYGLQVDEDEKTWSFLVLTHMPSGHFRLRYNPVTGKKNPEISFLNTTIRAKPKSTRLSKGG